MFSPVVHNQDHLRKYTHLYLALASPTLFVIISHMLTDTLFRDRYHRNKIVIICFLFEDPMIPLNTFLNIL